MYKKIRKGKFREELARKKRREMLLKSVGGRFLRKFFSEGLLRMKNSKRKENLLLRKSEKINGRRCFLNTFFYLLCTHTYIQTQSRPYQWISFILYFLCFSKKDFRQRFVAAALRLLKWVRCLKFFFISSFLRF